MTAKVTVSNHSAQLVKNVRVTMHRRPSGIDSAKMLPAITAGSSSVVEINRELGPAEDAPCESRVECECRRSGPFECAVVGFARAGLGAS
jgi:hypothetical protein